MRALAFIAIFLLLSSVKGSLRANAPSIEDYVAQIRDFSSVVQRTYVNPEALAQINKSYVDVYRIKTMQVYYKNPDQLRLEGKVGPVNVVYLINGLKKIWKIGPIRQEKREEDPAKRQGLLDFGVLTQDQITDYNTEFVRKERREATLLYLFKLRLKTQTNQSFRLFWVDPEKRIVVKRVTYDWKGTEVKSIFTYEKPVKIGKYWVPTVLKVYNGKGQLGAVSKQSQIKINTGLPNDLFIL